MSIGQGCEFPVHPIAGFSAIGFKKNGDPIWPVMGGSGEIPSPGSPDAGVPLVEGGNPAWNDFLQYVPEDERDKVVPVLKNWDSGVEQKFQSVHSEYEPWKDIVKSGLDPETVQFATEVLAALQEDPRKIYDSLGEHFQWNGSEAGEEAPSEQGLDTEEGQLADFDLENHPAFQTIAGQNRVMADILLAQRNQELERQEEAKLDTEIKEAKKTHGDFDEQYVLMYMAQNDSSVEDAVTAFNSFAEKIGGPARRPAPKLHSGSGGGAAPTPKLDTRKMSDKETRGVLVQMLEAANREG